MKAKFQLHRKAQRKYNTGPKPCLYCRTGDHNNCRPRIWDETLCSCRCPKSIVIREEVEMLQRFALREGKARSVSDCWKEVKTTVANWAQQKQSEIDNKVKDLLAKYEHH